ncbi:mediator of RNA polymerase II transcription subunit 1-like [Centruroides vittatus]|uniref:mediator of RNA polymerase II transcription subunit 1-like n=1 Tax=Centruroides vittatus TaxID=120091 RepID=UPI00350EFA7E
MAAVDKIVDSNTNHCNVPEVNGDVEKDDPLENLMEKLRTKASHYKSWSDMTKAIRMADKRHLIDNIERNQLQKCLDTIQKSIKVTSLQSMMERLESITRQQGLKFSLGPNGSECYISSDMFYIEIILEANGEVKDSKIAHHGDPLSCSELTKVLRSGDFSEFTKHLEGLSAIYQLNADKKQKTKAYLALHALEIDLSTLAQLQSTINDPTNLVHKSPVGILQLRQGGNPMKLTYFISPYDLLDVETKSSIPLTVDAVLERHLGHSVTVCIESSTAHKLQTMSLLSVSKTPEGKSLPSFAALSNLNSTTLPASFVLHLPNSIPMATNLIKKIQAVTNIECADMTTCQSLLSLIIKDMSEGKLECRSDQGLYVTLPDQHHCYFLNAINDLQGALVSAIPFTHPTHVPQILVFLRQQMLFNTVIGSCVRPTSKQNIDSAWIFEITALSTSHITVSFKHPMEESLATAELDLKDITNVKCKIYTLSSDASICTDEYASKVMQRCLSIPVTMRAVIRKAQGQQQQLRPSSQGDLYCAAVSSGAGVSYLSQHPNYGRNLANGTGFPSGEFTNLSSRMNGKQHDLNIVGTNNDQINHLGKTINMDHSSEQQMYNIPSTLSHNSDIINPIHTQSLAQTNSHQDLYSMSSDRTLANTTNPLLGTLLSQNSGTTAAQLAQYQQIKQGGSNTMLMSMLSDLPAANSPSTSFPFLSQGNTTVVAKPRKQRKRKTLSDSRSPGSTMGKSPKRKMSDDDGIIKDLPTPDVESSENITTPFEINNLSVGIPDQSLIVRVTPLESYLKSDVNAPQRTNSIDSSHTGISDTDTNAVNDDCSSSVDSYNSTQNKRQYSFTSESEYNADYIANKTSNFVENITESSTIDLDTCDANAFGMDLNPAIMASKLAASMDRQSKKLKKFKIENELKSNNILSGEEKTEVQDNRTNVDTNVSFLSSSFGSSLDRSHMDEQVSKTPPLSQSPDLGTSLKIARSGDSLKVSKSEGKLKRKEGKRTDDGSLSKKKGDAKKERKRKRIESADDDAKSPVRPLHLTLDSTLMPPPSTSSGEISPLVSTATDNQLVKHPKDISSRLSTSPSRSKSPSFSSKKNLLTAHRSNSPTSKSLQSGKTNQSEKLVKPLPLRQPQVSIGKSGSDSDGSNSFVNTKVTLSTSLKLQTKHKQGSNFKTSISNSSTGGTNTSSSMSCGQVQSIGSHSSGGGSSPSKVSTKPPTLKLKNLNLPSSTTITPIPVKTHSSPTLLVQSPIANQSVSTSSISIIPASSTSKALISGNNAKAGKSLLRSRKVGLNAVIDKLMVNASAQHIVPPGDNSKAEGSSDRKESKSEKKETSKESLKDREGSTIKSSESKPKYSSSDQFTVKQSSGIKLTVTKTKFTDNSKSLSKMKQLSKQPLSSNTANSTKVSSSSGSSSTVKTGSITTPKKSVSSSTCMQPKSSMIQSKNSGSVISKNQSPSSTSSSISLSSSSSLPRTLSSSANSVSKPKVTMSSQNKSLLNAKLSSEKSEKLKPVSTELKTSQATENRSDKMSNNFLNVGSNLMPPPLHNKSLSEHRSLSSSNVSSKHEESPLRQSPRHTPNRDNSVEESEGERAFRLLLAQTKVDNQNGTLNVEQRAATPKPVDVPSGGNGENNVSKHETVLKPELEEKSQWVSSSTDVKPTVPKCLSEKRLEELPSENIAVSDSSERKLSNTQIEALSTGKCELPTTVTPTVSAEESSRSSSSPFPPKTRRVFPSSEDSSPEDGLVIDCPGTPRLQKSPEKKVSWSSPRLETTVVNDEKIDSSSGPFNAKSPFQQSPSLKSPIPVTTPPSNHSASSSMSRPSPYDIDDELMDEALIGVGK